MSRLELMNLIVGMVVGLMTGAALMGLWTLSQRTATCPALGVVTINDAIVIVRECEDGRIIRDYPWEEAE